MICFVGRLFAVVLVCLLQVAVGHARVDIRMEVSPSSVSPDARHFDANGIGFLSMGRPQSNASPEPEFDRQTQAPLIWINLHKPKAGNVEDAPVQSFDSFAGQRVAQVKFAK